MDKLELKRILVAQKQEIEIVLQEGTLIDRELLADSKKYMDSSLIKVVTGIRRCGKSVFSLELLRQKKFAYVNFDDERLFRLAADDLNNVLEILHETYGDFKYLLLDEVQNIEAWELFANRCRRQGYNMIITGSNSKLLSRELATHLTGRFFELELYPFSFREYLQYFKMSHSANDLYLPGKVGEIKSKLSEYMERGGFPEALRYPDLERTYITDLYNAIIGKDIITRYNIRYSKILKDMATYLISSHSCEMSYNKLKNMFNAKSVHTVENYVSYIEEAYLVFLVFPFSFKAKLRMTSPKKVYAIDAGMINALSSRHFDDSGRLLENTVALELFRKKALEQTEVFYYKSQQQEEVDFVIRRDIKAMQLIQACYDIGNADTKEREIKGLLRASQDLKCDNLLIITWDYEGEEIIDKKKIVYTPLWKWLLI